MAEEKSFIEMINETIEAGEVKLPPFNKTALKIQQEISKSDPDTGVIEKLVMSDQALTSQVLKMANSAFFRGFSKVSTVRDAIVRLGISEITNFVLVATQKENFVSRDPYVNQYMVKLWEHSLACAIGSQWLARERGFHDIIHEVFFAALMHDIGKLFLLTAIENVKSSRHIKFEPSEILLNEIIDNLHTEQGYNLLKSWNLPEVYCETARNHHKEDVDSESLTLVIVKLVDKACNKIGISIKKDDSIITSVTPEAMFLGMSEIKLAELELKLEDALDRFRTA